MADFSCPTLIVIGQGEKTRIIYYVTPFIVDWHLQKMAADYDNFVFHKTNENRIYLLLLVSFWISEH